MLPQRSDGKRVPIARTTRTHFYLDTANNGSKGNKMGGVGIYTHADRGNRPPETFGGTTTIHSCGAYSGYLLLPVIRAKVPRCDG